MATTHSSCPGPSAPTCSFSEPCAPSQLHRGRGRAGPGGVWEWAGGLLSDRRDRQRRPTWAAAEAAVPRGPQRRPTWAAGLKGDDGGSWASGPGGRCQRYRGLGPAASQPGAATRQGPPPARGRHQPGAATSQGPPPARGRHQPGAATSQGPPPARGRHPPGAATSQGPPPARGRHQPGAATSQGPPPARGRHQPGAATAAHAASRGCRDRGPSATPPARLRRPAACAADRPRLPRSPTRDPLGPPLL
jgi:hypothetical protein